MKTYAFHSYKGGTGRTLALSNFAYALRKRSHKVLMIDFDLDAPGLPYKFEMQGYVRGGYVPYLMSTTPEERARGADRRARIALIKDYLVHIEKGLTLLPAGDPGRFAYWQQIGSAKFHSLFAFAEARTDEGKNPADRLAREHVNWRAFKEDLTDIKEAAGDVDYCLVDCRASQIFANVPLLAWSQHIVQFLNANREGVLGSLILRKLLDTSDLREDVPKLTCVVGRVPLATTKEELKAEITTFSGSTFKDTFVADLDFPVDDLHFLYEEPDLEMGDKLVFREVGRTHYPIAYNYSDLFASLQGLDNKKEKEAYRRDLKLKQADEVIGKYFRFSFSRGELLNKDNQTNVALRRETLKQLINSLAEDQESQLRMRGVSAKECVTQIKTSLENAGYHAGKSFGLEAAGTPEVWTNNSMPMSAAERLHQWCDFDRQTGLGAWSADYSPETRRGTVRLNNHFLLNTRDDVGSAFVRGYVRGVVSHLIGEVGKEARVRITDENSTMVQFVYEGE